MKKLLSILLTLCLSIFTLHLSAQQTLTVADGTATNEYVPIYGYWADAAQHNQVIYPETMLDNMIDSAITGITFYLSSSPSNSTWGSATFTITLGTTSDSSFSSATYVTGSFTEVYSGGVQVSNGELTIVFDTPFLYTGGNLLFDLTSTAGSYSSSTFSGLSSTGGSINAYTGSYSSDGPNIHDFIPKTSFTYTNPPLCMKPTNLVVSDITTSSATISWTGGDNDSYYNIEYMLSSGTDWDNALTDASYSPSVTLNNLQASSIYKVRVQTVCSDNSETDWSAVTTFQTGCEPISITDTDPWTEDFEGYLGGGEQPFVCWETPVTTPGGGPFVYCGYGNACHSGQNSAELKGANNMLVLPEFSNDITTLRLTFWATAVTPSNGTLEIGIVTDMNDPINNFEYIATAGTPGARGSSNAGNGNYMGPFDFNGAQATSGRIAFRYTSSGTGNSWNLDDFTVSIAPSCSSPVANSVTIANVTAFTAEVSWTDNDPNHNAWMVYYKADNANDWEFAPASSTTVELTNLEPSTDYEVYVVTVCSDGEGTDQTLHFPFTTTATCYPPTSVSISQITGTSAMVSWDNAIYGANDYTIAYSVAGQDNWIVETTDGTQFMLSNLEPSTAYDMMVFSNCDLGTADTVELNFTTKCLVGGDLTIGEGTSTTSYFPEYCLYNYSYTQQIFLSSEMGGAAEINSIAFDASSIGNANRNLQIYLMHTTATNSSAWLDASNAQQVYSGNTTLTVGWNTFNFTTPFQYNGTDNLVVIMIDATGSWNGTNYFYSHTASASLSRYNHRDDSPYSISSTPSSGTSTSTRNNVIFGVPCDSTTTCVAPNVYVTDITAESITVDWAPGYQESSWELEYTSDTDWTSVGTVTAPYELTGLDANMTYYIRIRSICGGGEYSGWSGTSARTECTAIDDLPFTENFDTYGTGTDVYPTCWYKINTYSSDRPYVSSTNYQGAGSLYFYAGSGTYNIAITPEFDASIDITTLQATFMYRGTYDGDKMLVGVMSDPTDASTFTIVDTVYPDATSVTTWVERTVIFDQYEGNGQYIAFKNEYATNYAYGYIDNLVINTASSCQKPSYLTITNVSNNEATLSWTANGDESSWNIAYGPVGIDPNDETDEDVIIVPANTNPFTLTGLDALTAYDVYIQADCSGGETSDWTLTPVRLETDGCDITDQCAYTFVVSDGYGDGWNGAYIEVVQNGIQVATVEAINHELVSTMTTDTILLMLCDNYPTQLVWHSASFDDEIAFTVIGFDGSQIINLSDLSSYSTNDVLTSFSTSCSGCMSPSNLAYTLSVDGSYADITWTAGSDETSWILEYQAGNEAWVTENITGTPTYTLNNLTLGTIYTIHVTADCGYGTSGYQELVLITPICEPDNQCTYTLNIFDSFGDGWNGAYITVKQNGIVVLDNITVPSSQNQNTVSIALCGDVATQLVWHSGNYDSECSFELMGPDNTIVTAQTSMSGFYTNDVIDTFTANCSGCLAPGNLTYTLSTDATSATITWTAGSDETSWVLEYQVENGTWNTENISGIPEYTLNNLTPSTNYTVRVKSDCGDGMSGYQTMSFLTPCAIEATPYSENFVGFDTQVSPCWERFSGLASDVFAGGALTPYNGGWSFNSSNVYPAGHPKVNIYGTSCNYWLVSPAIDLSQLSDPALMFNLALTDYYNEDPIEDTTAQADDQFMVIISTDFGVTWSATNATIWNNTTSGNYVYNAISHTGDSITIPLSQYAGQTIRIAFYGESTVGSNGDNDLHIANVLVGENGAGPVVTDPTVATNAATSIAQTSATLNATITNPSGVTITAKGFEWKQTVGGSYTQIAGSGTGNTFTANLTTLTANTDYTYKAFITFNGTTVYGDEMTFITPAEPVDPCDVPTNVTTSNVTYNAADVTWNAGTANAWNVQYKEASASAWGNSIAVTAATYHISGLNAETAYQVRVQANCGNGNLSDWTAPVNFTTEAEPVEPCDAPTNLDITNITPYTATMSWTAGGTETAWKVGYKLSTASQWQEATVQQTTYEIEGLTPESTYDVRVKAVCAADNESDFITSTFTTIPDAINEVTLAQSISLMPNPADNYIELRVNSNVVVKEVVVYNAFGQTIQTVNLTDNHARIDLSNVSSGMYFVRVNGDNVSATKKFIRK